MKIIAHRGASAHAPENTLAAARLAWEQGADAVEADLRLTRDGAVVVIHDETGLRTAGQGRRVRDVSLSEIRQWNAGRWKGAAWAGEPVPELAALLSETPPAHSLVLELKEGAGLAGRVRDVVGASGFPEDRLWLIAFDYEIIRAAKELLPGSRALWLFKDYASHPRETSGELGRWLAERAVGAGLDGVDLRRHPRLTGELVSELHSRGLSVFVYTVNDPAEARRFAGAGVDGLTTDDPAAMRAAICA
jgi:glycerophosphoryl diester phosphodiesterase